MTDALVETAEWLAWISEPVSDLTADEIKAWANRQPRRYQLQPVLPREGEWVTYWKLGAGIIETCLAKATKADPQDAPFPLVGPEAALWFRAQVEAFRHALEMMGPPEAMLAAAPPSPDRQGEVEELRADIAEFAEAASLLMQERDTAEAQVATLTAQLSGLMEFTVLVAAGGLSAKTQEKRAEEVLRALRTAHEAAAHNTGEGK